MICGSDAKKGMLAMNNARESRSSAWTSVDKLSRNGFAALYESRKSNLTHKNKDYVIKSISDLVNNDKDIFAALMKNPSEWFLGSNILAPAQAQLIERIRNLSNITKVSIRRIGSKMEVWVFSPVFDGQILDAISEYELQYWETEREHVDVVYSGEDTVDFSKLPTFDAEYQSYGESVE